jgi:hypothetical protein
LGEARPFDPARHHAFQEMMARCGDPAILAIQRRVAEAVDAGEPPSAIPCDRHGRAGIRVALRQMKAASHPSPVLAGWLASFDQGHPEDGDDEVASLHHDG